MKAFRRSGDNTGFERRPALERMMHISRKLQAGERFTATTVAREMEVSTKAIHRDIEFMRDRLGYVIEWVQIGNPNCGGVQYYEG